MRFLSALVLAVLLFVPEAYAHTPLCSCLDNGDGPILCQGGFSDGSSASGVTMSVMSGADTVLMEGRMNDESEFIFEKPKGEFLVRFDAGEGHVVVIRSKDIR